MSQYKARFLDLRAAQTLPSKSMRARMARARSSKALNRLRVQDSKRWFVDVMIKDAPNQYRAGTLAWAALVEKVGSRGEPEYFTLCSVTKKEA